MSSQLSFDVSSKSETVLNVVLTTFYVREMALKLNEILRFDSFTFPLAVLYFIFAIVTSIQIIRLICYRHRILSFQFGFLTMCTLWCILRAIYFSFYGYWAFDLKLGLALYWFPINIQLATFLFLVMFFMAVVHKDNWEAKYKKRAALVFIGLNVFFLVLFIVSFVVMKSMVLQPLNQPHRLLPWINTVRKSFSAALFLLLFTILGIYAYKVRQYIKRSKGPIPQLQGIGVRKLTAVTWALVILFTTRCASDFVCVFMDDCALSVGEYHVGLPTFGQLTTNWLEDVVSFMLYVLWEIVPAFMVTALFWRIPSTSPQHLKSQYQFYSSINSVSSLHEVSLFSSASVFQNPKRYDSDEETASLLRSAPTGHAPLSFKRLVTPLPNSLGGYTAYSTSQQSE